MWIACRMLSVELGQMNQRIAEMALALGERNGVGRAGCLATLRSRSSIWYSARLGNVCASTTDG
jgi:hypothetical protein